MSLFLMLLQVSSAPPAPPPPPPIVVHHDPAANQARITSFRASAVRCDGVGLTPERIEPVIPVLQYGEQSNRTAVTLRFRIDASGRPLSISGTPATRYGADGDLMPSFAAWRFAAGADRANCSVTFYPASEAIASADRATLARFAALEGYGRPEARAAIDRIVPPGSTCMRDWPQVLTQVFPRFDALPGLPGTITTANVVFDIDADGDVADARVAGAGGSPELDRAAVEATEQWRYAEGPRQGCLYPLWRSSSEPLTPPEMPLDDAERCPSGEQWKVAPRLTYPQPYSRRKIEGWAIVGYDVAPWGEIGNLRVVASEPTSEFGTAALNVVRNAQKVASDTGASGCTARVLFKLPNDQEKS